MACLSRSAAVCGLTPLCTVLAMLADHARCPPLELSNFNAPSQLNRGLFGTNRNV